MAKNWWNQRTSQGISIFLANNLQQIETMHVEMSIKDMHKSQQDRFYHSPNDFPPQFVTFYSKRHSDLCRSLVTASVLFTLGVSIKVDKMRPSSGVALVMSQIFLHQKGKIINHVNKKYAIKLLLLSTRYSG